MAAGTTLDEPGPGLQPGNSDVEKGENREPLQLEKWQKVPLRVADLKYYLWWMNKCILTIWNFTQCLNTWRFWRWCS
jgi:hypothetical protein